MAIIFKWSKTYIFTHKYFWKNTYNRFTEAKPVIFFVGGGGEKKGVCTDGDQFKSTPRGSPRAQIVQQSWSHLEARKPAPLFPWPDSWERSFGCSVCGRGGGGWSGWWYLSLWGISKGTNSIHHYHKQWELISFGSLRSKADLCNSLSILNHPEGEAPGSINRVAMMSWPKEVKWVEISSHIINSIYSSREKSIQSKESDKGV